MLSKTGSCIICPLYMKERDYKYAIEFYRSKIDLNIDVPIYFIFSYKEHVEGFNSVFKEEFGWDYDDYILVPEEYLQYKCQVTTKKLYGVKMLQDKYNYIGVVDCECLFIKNCDVNTKFKEIWDDKTVMVSTKSYLLRSLLKYCVDGLNLQSAKQIKDSTDNYLYNCWFNEIPVYNTQYTHEFFSWLESQNLKKILDSYYMVDYYIYLLFMMDRYSWTIKKMDIWSPVGLMEEISHSHPDMMKELMSRMGTHWTSDISETNANTFMLFHRDHKPTKNEFKEFLLYSKLRYYLGRVVGENRKIIGVFNRVIPAFLRTSYFLKYRW